MTLPPEYAPGHLLGAGVSPESAGVLLFATTGAVVGVRCRADGTRALGARGDGDGGGG